MAMQNTLNQFIVGELYSNDEIFKSFKVANAGGLRFRMQGANIEHAVVMTSVPLARKAKENPYHDRIENGFLTYTAAGREGDQTLSGMNQRLPSQLTLDFPIHGFLIVANRNDKTIGPKRWQYMGLLEYVRHFPDTQLDTRGDLRKVWVFEFRIHCEPDCVPLELHQHLMAEILADSRKRNPSSEEERTISSLEHTPTRIEPARVEAVRGRLLNVDPEKFEHLLKDFLSATGFERIQVTKFSQDGGVDLSAYTGNLLWPLGDCLIQIQAKRWMHTVGRKEVAELRGSLQPYARGTIVTTSHFTKAAMLEASENGKNPIHLLDGFELSKAIIERNFENLI